MFGQTTGAYRIFLILLFWDDIDGEVSCAIAGWENGA